MPLQLLPTELPGVIEVATDIFTDRRGRFAEIHRADRYAALGIGCAFVQDNYSRSTRGVLRGMHLQLKAGQDKLVCVLRGAIFDVAVDVRRGSPAFGCWTARVLSEENGRQLFVPRGFAHGFCVLAGDADVLYKCSAVYAPGDEVGFHYASRSLGIPWPTTVPVLSDRDAALPPLEDLPPDRLPLYSGVSAP
jgi:dTDP-4-dehydrorhamnose 3,5-epimerase